MSTTEITTPQVERCKRLMLAITLNQPVLGLASVRTHLKPGMGYIPTAGVDARGTIYIGEEFFAKLSDEEARFVLGHELMHLLLYHYDRRGDRNHRRWNKAADRWINHYLRTYCSKGGAMRAPSSALFPLEKGHEDWSVEQLYDVEPEDDSDEPPMPTAGCGPDGDPHPGTGVGTDAPGPMGQAPTPGEIANNKATWRRIAETAKAMAREAGSEAGAALARALTPPPPRVKWSTLLKRVCDDAEALAGDDDVSWQRRNRRRQDVYIPGSITTTVNVAVVIDTSGSVPDESLNQAVAETAAIARETGTGLYLVTHDAIVQAQGWVTDSIPKIQEFMKGRGGTTFTPAYEAVAAVRRRFQVMVHLTDACPCEEWPAKPRNVSRAIIALIGYAAPDTPSWATAIPVDV